MKKSRLPLSKTEDKIWGYLLGYISDNGYSPTKSEIAVRFKLKSDQAVHYFLKRMETKGYILLVKGEWRNIRIIQQ